MLAPYLHQMGGVTTHTQKMAEYLSLRDDIELHVLSVGADDVIVAKGNMSIHTIGKHLPYPLAFPSVIRSLRRRTMELDPHIVHAQSSGIPYSTVACLLSKQYPVVLTVHGLVAADYKHHRGIEYLVHRFLHLSNERRVVTRVADIIAVSSYVRRFLHEYYKTHSTVHMVPNGIDLRDVAGICFESSKACSVLFVGTLQDGKGVDLLLRAIPVVKRSIPNPTINIIGSGPAQMRLRALARQLDVQANVRFLGHISGPDKFTYYKATDIFILPSRQETFGIVLLEAMLSGKAVVASRVGGIPDVVEDGKTGLLFECGNVHDMAEKIVLLLQNKELRENMGRKGEERSKEFCWEKIAQQTVEVYHGMLARWRNGL